MNERIKQIAFEAGQGGHSWYNDPNCLQAFTQLIVKECVGIGSNIVLEQTEDNDMGVFLGIKKHFGVEE